MVTTRVSLVLKQPAKSAREAIKRRLAFDQNTSVLSDGEQRDWIRNLRSLLPSIDEDIIAEVFLVRSYQRRSYLFHGPRDTVIIDDELRNHTFESLEEFFLMRDRPLIPFLYFSVIFAELVASSGFRHALPLAERLQQLTGRAFDMHKNDKGYVERPALFIKTLRIQLKGENPAEKKQKQAAFIYPVFHEIGHMAFSRDSHRKKELRLRIRRLCDEMYSNATLGDSAMMYWGSPSTLDPRYGPSRVENGTKDSMDSALRNEVVEEVYCDWFAACLLLASPALDELSAETLLEVIVRHLAWNQLLLDARMELKQVAEGRKRWRTLVYDASCFRQQMIFYLLDNLSLARDVFGVEFASKIESRMAGFDNSKWTKRIQRMIIKRQYIRFLALSHPLSVDVQFVPNSLRTIALLYPDDANDLYPDDAIDGQFIYRVNENMRYESIDALDGYDTSNLLPLTHQPAEWGTYNPDLMRADIDKYIFNGRLDALDVNFDGPEGLAPYIEEGYRLLCLLRQLYWNVLLENDRKPVSVSDQPTHDVLTEIASTISDYCLDARLGETQYLSENLDILLAACFDCSHVFPIDFEAIDLNAKIADSLKCPKCGSLNTGNTLMSLVPRNEVDN